MITKMKKLTFLVYHKEYEEFLNSLRELGVVHIVEKQQGAADNTELQENIRLFNRLAATLKLLQNQKHEKNAVIATEGGTATRGMQVLDEVDALQTEHGKLSQQLQSYAKEKEVLEVWGNFEPTGIQKLKDAGYIQCDDCEPYFFQSILCDCNEGRTGSGLGCGAGETSCILSVTS